MACVCVRRVLSAVALFDGMNHQFRLVDVKGGMRKYTRKWFAPFEPHTFSTSSLTLGTPEYIECMEIWYRQPLRNNNSSTGNRGENFRRTKKIYDMIKLINI